MRLVFIFWAIVALLLAACSAADWDVGVIKVIQTNSNMTVIIVVGVEQDVKTN